ncbi:MAG: TRAP transporter small permease [Pseudomonadota bacterium]
MRAIARLAAIASTVTGFLGKIAVLLMMAHIGLDLVLRVVVGTAPEGMPEAVARIYMVMVVFLPMALTQSTGRQIEVAFFADLMPRTLQRIQSVFAALVTAGLAGLIAYLSFDVALEATRRGERLDLLAASLPIWPARWAVVAGFAALALSALVQAFGAAPTLPGQSSEPV